MRRGFFGNFIFAIIARMLCGNHLNFALVRPLIKYIKSRLQKAVISVVSFFSAKMQWLHGACSYRPFDYLPF